MEELITQVEQGQRRAIARLISRIEDDEEAARQAILALYPRTGQAHIVGVTGAPGSGKSSLVNELAKTFRQRSLSVGIVAVDPSSPFTGGALLGDRVRMRDLAGDNGIFIRSMASRGSLGGLARATWAVVHVLDAAGFDLILIETVGAGQVEVEIAGTAHTTLVVEAPGMGDEIQTSKAGILEIADILVVNKADRPGAGRTVQALRLMLQLGGQQPHPPADPADEPAGWPIPVLEAVATEGRGIEKIADQIMAHRRYLETSGEWRKREQERGRQQVERLLQGRLMAQLAASVPQANRDGLLAAVAARELDPYTAVDRLFDQMSVHKGEEE